MEETVERFILVSTTFSLLRIAIYFILAWLVHRLAWRIASVILHLHGFTLPSGLPSQFNRFAHTAAMLKKWISGFNEWLPDELKATHKLRQERQETLQELVSSGVSLLAFLGAILASLREFAEPDTIVWMVGLFGTAFAFAGRTFIGDFLAGLSIIFQDKFDVGENILIKAQFEKIEGTVEHVSLNATWLRARTGELYIIANAEMRFVCNFSRGLHSSANIIVKIATADLNRALPLLKNLGQEAVALFPSLEEPWQVISEMGDDGAKCGVNPGGQRSIWPGRRPAPSTPGPGPGTVGDGRYSPGGLKERDG